MSENQSCVYRGKTSGLRGLPYSSVGEILLPFKDNTRLGFTPAVVLFSPDYLEVSIFFDRYQSGYCTTGQTDGPEYSNHSLVAKFSEGQLTLNGKPVINNLVELVQEEILREKGLL